jgi:hypothetical protein
MFPALLFPQSISSRCGGGPLLKKREKWRTRRSWFSLEADTRNFELLAASYTDPDCGSHRHVTFTKNEQDEYLSSDEEGDSVISALGMEGDLRFKSRFDRCLAFSDVLCGWSSG